MDFFRSKVVTILISLVMLAILFHLVRRKKLKEEYALLWLAMGIAGIVLASWRGLLHAFSSLAGIYDPANAFFLDPRGSARKTTGSYYTHHSLVNELIKSALLPVARDRLARAGLPVIDQEAIGEATAGLLTDYSDLTDAQRQVGEDALLSIKVCDPAVGSGHFLVKANNALGAELARLRTGDEYPT